MRDPYVWPKASCCEEKVEKASRRPRPRRAEHKEGGGTPPLPQPVLNSDPDPNLGPWWVNRTWVRFKVRHRVGPNPVNPSGPDRTRT